MSAICLIMPAAVAVLRWRPRSAQQGDRRQHRTARHQASRAESLNANRTGARWADQHQREEREQSDQDHCYQVTVFILILYIPISAYCWNELRRCISGVRCYPTRKNYTRIKTASALRSLVPVVGFIIYSIVYFRLNIIIQISCVCVSICMHVQCAYCVEKM